MKRPLNLIFVLLAAAFAWISVSKWIGDSEPAEGVEVAKDEEQRAGIRAFWEAYHEATRLRIDGDYAGARQAYERALTKDPNHEESLYYLGNCLFELGDYRGALRIYERIVELNPSSQRGFSQLGILLSTPLPGNEPRPDLARKAFLRNAEINPEESGPFLRLGLLSLQEGNWDEAYGYFRTAAGFRSPEGYFMSGYVRFHQQRYQEAEEFFRRVLDIEARERQISGRGVLSEGDVTGSADGLSLTPLQAAAVKSRAYLDWSRARQGRQSAEESGLFPGRDRRFLEQRSSLVGAPGAGDSSGRVTWADYDGDGDPDLLISGKVGLRLFRNDAGRLNEQSIPGLGIDTRGPSWDSSWGDYDGDGDLDLYVVGSGLLGSAENVLYRNEGPWSAAQRGRFIDRTDAAALKGVRSTSRALFLDFDRDGRMDLVEAGPSTPALRLFRNLNGETFQESAAGAGIRFQGAAVDLGIGDYDGDGYPDLFVLRWKQPGLLLRNNQDGTFSERTEVAGLKDVGGDGYSVLFFDFDRDGRLDLLVSSHADYEAALLCLQDPEVKVTRQRPRLFRNRDGQQFVEVTEDVGLSRGYGTMQVSDVDVDLDGWPDILLANGGLQSHRLEPTVVLRNSAGRRFDEYLFLPSLSEPSNTPGLAAADFDGDGRIEVFLPGSGLFRIR